MAQLLTVAAQLEVWRPMCGAPGLVGSGLGRVRVAQRAGHLGAGVWQFKTHFME